MPQCATQTITPECSRSGSPAVSPVTGRRGAGLSRWQVLLHDDDHNEMGYVVDVLVRLRARDLPGAIRVMFEAHRQGVGLVMETHLEHAEHVAEQLLASGLTASVQEAPEA